MSPPSSVMIRVWSWLVRKLAFWLAGHAASVSMSPVCSGAARPFWSASRIAVASPKSKVMSTLSGTYGAAIAGGSQTSPTSRASGLTAATESLKPASHAFVSGVFVWASFPSSMRCFAASRRKPSTPTSSSQNRAMSSSSAVVSGLRRLRSGMPSQNTP